MADTTGIQLPRRKIIHLAMIAVGFAIVFGVLTIRPEKSFWGLRS